MQLWVAARLADGPHRSAMRSAEPECEIESLVASPQPEARPEAEGGFRNPSADLSTAVNGNAVYSYLTAVYDRMPISISV